ncbi:PLP-dependent aminotransferase family protein [Roseibium sediminicola]|uniref:PLP-dependent aminotransferase family protein n=1 Tax=Roseibium sediminicola TaxID=2933272 RepID=A0ABT0H2X0_9HYPH|nr:PLP-dependent aminotransferase family protein [Roseibium sp. CAU 1639]MCK7615642.1 PLP-dependent aminotransferase family protein [Roseibium sp. CAU 1639]
MTMWIPNIEAAAGPIYLAIADALEDDIKTGALAQGDRLPPQRELAYQLGVTLGTITRAYGEAERRRLVKGETGRGTYIASETQKVSPLVPKEDEPDSCDLARNFAYPHLNPSLSDGLVRMARTAGIDRLNGFVPSEGLKTHRETGVLVFKDYGLEADPARVAVTCGAQHGIQVTCQALFRAGDAIAVDRFTYPSIFSSLSSLGLKPVPVPALTRTDGGFGAMDPEALARAAAAHGVRGVFLMPNMQNPTTHTMSVEERQDLVRVAREHDLKIVEDDPYTPFLPETLPAFGALAPERTASIASISKVCSPGSRIGFVHVPKAFGDSIRNKIGESTWMASPITAELIAGWVREGHLFKTLRLKRKANRNRFLKARDLLAPHFLQGDVNKVFGWLRLPDIVDADALQAALSHQGISVLSSRYFQGKDHAPAPYLRLTFGSEESDERFQWALKRIQATIDQMADLPELTRPVG